VVATPAAAAPSTPPVTFIEALAAIPDATRELASTRLELRAARSRQGTVRSAAEAAHRDLDDATETARAAHAAVVRADIAAALSQAAIDDAARTMYAAGGAPPTVIDVMLTADSELGLARSLVTRQYLDSVGDRMLVESDRAGRAREWAAVSASGATARREAALARTAAVDASLATVVTDVRAKQAGTDRARGRYRMLMRMTKVDRSEDYGRLKTCGDWLTRLLSRSGFEGEDLREAWAIVMRESGGREDAISRTDDLGLFQINTATWRKQPWFDRELLLTRKYNAQVAHTLSRGGGSWYSWGLDGHGRPDARAYVKSGWSEERIVDSIVMPYVQWYAQYPCRPTYEKDLGLGLPERPLADEGKDGPALQEGAGVRPDEGGIPVPETAPVAS
jgi:Lysozyme like domain